MVEGFLTQLRRVNTERYFAWTEGADAGIMFDALELGGEVGELLNVVKKLDREQRGWRGSRAEPADFADECADVLICLDKLARRLNVDLETVTIAKFNATSDKVGLPHRLAAAPTLDYKAAWKALSDPLSWMHESNRLKQYWGWNLADIANDLIDKAYPGLRFGKARATTALATPPATSQEEKA
jgi:NTP pyrophosphatase (non-canonical NTP hydrolase)